MSQVSQMSQIRSTQSEGEMTTYWALPAAQPYTMFARLTETPDKFTYYRREYSSRSSFPLFLGSLSPIIQHYNGSIYCITR